MHRRQVKHKFAMFNSFFRHYWLLSTFRSSPVRSDGSTRTILILYGLLLFLSITVGLWRIGTAWLNIYIADFVVTEILIAISIYLLLLVRNFTARFRKTLSSYLGVNLVISLALTAGFAVLGSSTLLSLLISCWHIAAFGYVLHVALEVKYWQGLLIALLVFMFVALVVAVIFVDFYQYLSESALFGTN